MSKPRETRFGLIPHHRSEIIPEHKGQTHDHGSRGADGRWATLALIGVLALFALLGTAVAVKTPAYESADEPSHVQNIETMASGHWYGMNSRCRDGDRYCSGFEAHQAPLYYLAFAAWQSVAGLHVRAPFHGDPTFGAQNGLFLHHSSSDHSFLLWLRLPNVLLGALTVLFTFFAVRLVSTDPWTPVVGAAMVAFLPRFVFLSAFVTNDNLVNLIGAVLTVAALRFVRIPSRLRMAVVGVVVGLLVITKLSALPIAVVLVALSLMVTGWRRRATTLGIGLLSTLAVCGWYLAQNTLRYGDPLARTASARYLAQVGGLGLIHVGEPYRVSDPLGLIFVHVPANIVNSLWYQSGWDQFHWPWSVNVLFWLVLAAALVGIIHRRIERRVLLTLGTLVVAAFVSVWGVAFQTATYQGRYALVGLTALAGLVALGLERWKLPVRFFLPAMGFIGTLIAIQQDVLAVHWAP